MLFCKAFKTGTFFLFLFFSYCVVYPLNMNISETVGDEPMEFSTIFEDIFWVQKLLKKLWQWLN